MSGRGVIVERTVLGDVARVAAVDEATGVEAVVLGPASAAPRDLETLAMRKLERLLAPAGPAAPTRKGRLV